MSIPLKMRLEIWEKKCEEGLKVSSLEEKDAILGYILGGVQSTLGTPREDIRRLLDVEPQGQEEGGFLGE